MVQSDRLCKRKRVTLFNKRVALQSFLLPDYYNTVLRWEDTTWNVDWIQDATSQQMQRIRAQMYCNFVCWGRAHRRTGASDIQLSFAASIPASIATAFNSNRILIESTVRLLDSISVIGFLDFFCYLGCLCFPNPPTTWVHRVHLRICVLPFAKDLSQRRGPVSRLEPFPAVDGRVCQPLRVSDAVTTQLEHATHKQTQSSNTNAKPTSWGQPQDPQEYFPAFFSGLVRLVHGLARSPMFQASPTNSFSVC